MPRRQSESSSSLLGGALQWLPTNKFKCCTLILAWQYIKCWLRIINNAREGRFADRVISLFFFIPFASCKECCHIEIARNIQHVSLKAIMLRQTLKADMWWVAIKILFGTKTNVRMGPYGILEGNILTQLY